MAWIVFKALFFYQLAVVRENIKAQVTNTTHMKRDYPMYLIERRFEVFKGAYTFYTDRQPIGIHIFASEIGIRKDYLDIRSYGVFIYPCFSSKQSPNDGLTL